MAADDDGLTADHARAAARLGKVVEKAVGEVDLTLPQYRMLAFLAEGTSAASVLAGNLAVSKPSLTALADGLVARGLVERRPPPATAAGSTTCSPPRAGRAGRRRRGRPGAASTACSPTCPARSAARRPTASPCGSTPSTPPGPSGSRRR